MAEVALSRYMGTMARHGVAAERRLRKRGDRWRVIEWMEPKLPTNESSENPSQSQSVDILNQTNPNSPSMIEVVVYSFFAPWVTSAQHEAHRFTAKTNRLTTRDHVREKNDKYIQSRLNSEKDQQIQSSQNGGTSPNYGSARTNSDRGLPILTSVPSSDRGYQDTNRS